MALPAEMVVWAVSSAAFRRRNCRSRGGNHYRVNGTWNCLCVSLGLCRLELVVHIDHNMPSDDGGLKQRRGLAVETRSQVEFMGLYRKCVSSKPHGTMGVK